MRAAGLTYWLFTGKGQLPIDKLKLSDFPATFIRPQIVRNTVSFTTVEIATLDRKSQDCLRDISVMSNFVLTELLAQLRSIIGSLYR